MRGFYKNMTAADRLKGVASGRLLITETYQEQSEMRSDIVAILLELTHAEHEAKKAISDLQKFRNARDTIQAEIMAVFKKFHHSFGEK
jgi:NH3-dependent NAD+ synthetase